MAKPKGWKWKQLHGTSRRHKRMSPTERLARNRFMRDQMRLIGDQLHGHRRKA